MKELIKLEVTVKLSYNDKKYREEGIKDALKDVLQVSTFGRCTSIPIKAKLIKPTKVQPIN